MDEDPQRRRTSETVRLNQTESLSENFSRFGMHKCKPTGMV
jgi:hypothetical protein